MKLQGNIEVYYKFGKQVTYFIYNKTHSQLLLIIEINKKTMGQGQLWGGNLTKRVLQGCANLPTACAHCNR
jgi:hypothetical protein